MPFPIDNLPRPAAKLPLRRIKSESLDDISDQPRHLAGTSARNSRRQTSHFLFSRRFLSLRVLTMSAAPASVSLAAGLAARRPPHAAVSIPGVKPASALQVHPPPDMVSFGIGSLDALTGGIPRGALTEMVGSASSGRTSITMSLIAEITRQQEVCAVIDASDSFDPASAAAAGIVLDRVLWVRCGKHDKPAGADRAIAQSSSSAPPTPHVEGKPGFEAHEPHAPSALPGAARTRSNPGFMASLSRVTPPAKHISWSIQENYDARLRHAFTGNHGDKRVWRSPSAPVAVVPVNEHEAVVRPRNFAQERAARWNRLDQALKATDLLIQSGGFGLILVDLGDIPADQARRIPLTSWFRFRRAVENTPTILLVIARDTCAKTCASLVMNLSAAPQKSGHSPLTHICLLDGLQVEVELARTRLERKPMRSVKTQVQTETPWRKAG